MRGCVAICTLYATIPTLFFFPSLCALLFSPIDCQIAIPQILAIGTQSRPVGTPPCLWALSNNSNYSKLYENCIDRFRLTSHCTLLSKVRPCALFAPLRLSRPTLQSLRGCSWDHSIVQRGEYLYTDTYNTTKRGCSVSLSRLTLRLVRGVLTGLLWVLYHT